MFEKFANPGDLIFSWEMEKIKNKYFNLFETHKLQRSLTTYIKLHYTLMPPTPVGLSTPPFCGDLDSVHDLSSNSFIFVENPDQWNEKRFSRPS